MVRPDGEREASGIQSIGRRGAYSLIMEAQNRAASRGDSTGPAWRITLTVCLPLMLPRCRRPGRAAVPRHRPGPSARAGQIAGGHPQRMTMQVYHPAGRPQYGTAAVDLNA